MPGGDWKRSLEGRKEETVPPFGDFNRECWGRLRARRAAWFEVIGCMSSLVSSAGRPNEAWGPGRAVGGLLPV